MKWLLWIIRFNILHDEVMTMDWFYTWVYNAILYTSIYMYIEYATIVTCNHWSCSLLFSLNMLHIWRTLAKSMKKNLKHMLQQIYCSLCSYQTLSLIHEQSAWTKKSTHPMLIYWWEDLNQANIALKVSCIEWQDNITQSTQFSILSRHLGTIIVYKNDSFVVTKVVLHALLHEILMSKIH